MISFFLERDAAEAHVNMAWNYKAGTLPTGIMRGGIVLSSSNGAPTAQNFHTLPSNIPGIGIRMKDNGAAGMGATLFYLTNKTVPAGTR